MPFLFHVVSYSVLFFIRLHFIHVIAFVAEIVVLSVWPVLSGSHAINIFALWNYKRSPISTIKKGSPWSWSILHTIAHMMTVRICQIDISMVILEYFLKLNVIELPIISRKFYTDWAFEVFIFSLQSLRRYSFYIIMSFLQHRLKVWPYMYTNLYICHD